MINKDDKKYLYWIMEYYLSKKIDGEAFSNAFHESYGLELDYTCLNEKERKVFNELNAVVGRYTHFETDLINYPGVYFNDVLSIGLTVYDIGGGFDNNLYNTEKWWK
jgi:hypothetical protein